MEEPERTSTGALMGCQIYISRGLACYATMLASEGGRVGTFSKDANWVKTVVHLSGNCLIHVSTKQYRSFKLRSIYLIQMLIATMLKELKDQHQQKDYFRGQVVFAPGYLF